MTRKTLMVILAALLLVATLAGGAVAQTPWSEFDGILADEIVATVSVTAPDVTVSDDLAVSDVTTTDSLVVTGNSTMAGTLAVTGALAAATDFNLTVQSGVVVTSSAAFTPTGSLQPISATGNATPTTITAGSQGQMLVLVNTGSPTITLADSGDLLLTAQFVMGQWDTLTLVYYGTKWIELARANN